MVHKKDGRVTVGPDSVGYRLTDEALVFGGKTLTATDIAVAAGMAHIGPGVQVDADVMSGSLARIQVMLELAIDSVKISPNVRLNLPAKADDSPFQSTSSVEGQFSSQRHSRVSAKSTAFLISTAQMRSARLWHK